MASINQSVTPSSTLVYSFQKPLSQRFSIPEHILFYIAKNPSPPKVWLKLIQTCKYFYGKNHVIILDRFYWENSKKFNVAESSSTQKQGWKACLKNEKDVSIDIENMDYKLWIDGDLSQGQMGPPPFTISSLIPKIYRCDLIKLSINNQKITYNEFLFLVSNKKLKCLIGSNINIVYDNGEIVPFERILASVPNISDFSWGDHHQKDPSKSIISNCFTSQTAREMTTLPIFKNLNRFALYGLPECFDFHSFWNFVLVQPYLRKQKPVPYDPKAPMVKLIRNSLSLHFDENVPKDHRENVKNFLKEGLNTIPKNTRPSIFFEFDYIYTDDAFLNIHPPSDEDDISYDEEENDH